MKYTFLHLSDLHFRQGWHEESGLVLKRFAEDLLEQVGKYENLHLIFSGDLVQAGGQESAYDHFSGSLEPILTNAGLTRDRRICVPGNHDVDRNAIKKSLPIQMGGLATLVDEHSFNNNFAELSTLFFASKFRNYIGYEKKFAKYTCCAEGIGGTGYRLDTTLGIYCLNTALCSFGGLEDPISGKKISDQNRLMIETRSLQAWLANYEYKTRILVLHHPLNWLSEWAQVEMERIIASNFDLVFSGHVHRSSATYTSDSIAGAVTCTAPPLFTRKSDHLGYAFCTLDTVSGVITVDYREWSPKQLFVKGTSLAGNDEGTVSFQMRTAQSIPIEVLPPVSHLSDTLSILQAEFDEANTSYSSKRIIWIDRDISNIPETDKNRDQAVLVTQDDFVNNPYSCIVRAPKQYGLTCLGKYIALEYFRKNSNGKLLISVDSSTMPDHRQGVIQYINSRISELQAEAHNFTGIILDNWNSDKHGKKLIREIESEFPNKIIIILQNLDDCTEIGNSIQVDEIAKFKTLYLWALTRTRIRELVTIYLQGANNLDDDLVTKKVIDDLDSLNIHRSPVNSLLILKLTAQAFDDSPVNRTEMIGRVLYLLFYEFDQIPTYATRPDLRDCEYGLGYFCEWLLKGQKNSFSKGDFYTKIQEYCKSQLIDLDIDVLFSFLASEHIFVRKGFFFEFRFNYWLYYFAAHRMHHNTDFAEYVLSERRYAAFPEIVEFYAGIDRRRSDAVVRLSSDLKAMNDGLLQRTGINQAFNPFEVLVWNPTPDDLNQLELDVNRSIAESTLPAILKDKIADKTYDRSKPYNQALAQFIEESSLRQLIPAIRGASRVLRNSDHVAPSDKAELLKQVMCSWVRVCQVLAFLSPILAKQGHATFEGISFILSEGFDDTSERARWMSVLDCIVTNVVTWYQEDLFSKKMGALVSNHISNHKGELDELLALLVMIRQRPPGWEKEVERFVVRSHKNSYYLSEVFTDLRSEFKLSFTNERTRQDLRKLSAMSLAKHTVGVKHPNAKLVDNIATQIDSHDAKNQNDPQDSTKDVKLD